MGREKETIEQKAKRFGLPVDIVQMNEDMMGCIMEKIREKFVPVDGQGKDLKEGIMKCRCQVCLDAERLKESEA